MMKLNLLLLSAAALINAATAVDVDLGSAGNYAILASSGITNVPKSAVTGNMGISPGKAADITAFDLVLDKNSGEFSKSPQVFPVPDTDIPGNVYAADYHPTTKKMLKKAVKEMKEAYTHIAKLDADADKDEPLEPKGGEIGGETLTPGTYTFEVDINISSEVTFSGGATDVFIIRTTKNLLQAANKNVILAGDAKAENIFWQVAGNVAVGAGAHLEGVILAKKYVTFKTGSTLNGRVMTQTACNLQMATITAA
jgi:hypothetical protein